MTSYNNGYSVDAQAQAYFNSSQIFNACSQIYGASRDLYDLESKIRGILEYFGHEDLSIDGDGYDDVIERLADEVKRMADYANKYSSDMEYGLNKAIYQKAEELRIQGGNV